MQNFVGKTKCIAGYMKVANVWLHGSAGIASRRYCEGHGSNPIEALIFFRLLLSSCLKWKIYCDDHSSLSQLRMNYFIYTSHK